MELKKYMMLRKGNSHKSNFRTKADNEHES